MESAYWKTLIEVVDSGSFSRAAENLCITQSAVSRRIRFLEEQYGYPLLDRSSTALRLTPAGQVVLDKARHILSLESELAKGLESLQSRRSFSFCCTPAFGIVYLPRVLHRFMLRNANLVDVKFVFDMPARVVQGLQDGLYDLAVIEHCESFELGGFSTVALPGDEMVFVSSNALDLPAGVVDLDLLLQQPLLTRKEGCCSRTLLEANLARLGRSIGDFSKVAIVDDIQVILKAVLQGSAISFLSNSILRDHADFGSLVWHQVAGFQHRRRRTLLRSQGGEACGMLADFEDAVMQAFQLDKANGEAREWASSPIHRGTAPAY